MDSLIYYFMQIYNIITSYIFKQSPAKILNFLKQWNDSMLQNIAHASVIIVKRHYYIVLWCTRASCCYSCPLECSNLLSVSSISTRSVDNERRISTPKSWPAFCQDTNNKQCGKQQLISGMCLKQANPDGIMSLHHAWATAGAQFSCYMTCQKYLRQHVY